MADGKSTRPLKPKPGVIDLEAKEIGAEPAAPPPEADHTTPAPDTDAGTSTPEPTSEPVEPESAPEADEPKADEPQPVREASAPVTSAARPGVGALIGAGLVGGVVSASALAALLALGIVPNAAPVVDTSSAERIAGLEAQVSKLASAPAPEIPPPPPPFDDSGLRAEITALKGEIETLRAVPAPEPVVVQDEALETRINELTSRLDALSSALEERAASTAFDQLAARVADLSEKTNAPPPPDPAVEQALAGVKSAATLAAISSLESAVARGAPYAAALSSVRGHLPDGQYDLLEKDAENGLAAPQLLATRLLASLEKAPAPASTATNLVDRLKEGAWGLVRVRPVDGSVPEIVEGDAWSVRNAVTTRLAQGDYAAALADWEKLDEAAKTASRADAEALKTRLAVDAQLDALRAAALGAEARN